MFIEVLILNNVRLPPPFLDKLIKVGGDWRKLFLKMYCGSLRL